MRACVVERVESTPHIGDGDLGAMHVERPHPTLSQITRSCYRYKISHCSQLLSVSRAVVYTIQEEQQYIKYLFDIFELILFSCYSSDSNL
jgi:hypothetical protein